MNYIREINAFYDWLETNDIPNSCITLWHALMNVCNKAGWVPEFSVAISTLESKTGMRKDALITARQKLHEAGLIVFHSRAGQKSAVYHLVSIASEKPTQSPTQIEEKSDCVGKTDTNTDTNDPIVSEIPTLTPTDTKLNKDLNKTKDQEVVEKRARDPACDQEFAKVINFFDHNIHPNGGTESGDLSAWLDEGFESEAIILAMKEAVRAGARNMKYINGTLRNWSYQGFTTEELVLAHLKDWQDKKNKTKGRDTPGDIRNGCKSGIKTNIFRSEYPAGGVG